MGIWSTKKCLSVAVCGKECALLGNSQEKQATLHALVCRGCHSSGLAVLSSFLRHFLFPLAYCQLGISQLPGGVGV